ncbi:MAG: hypothetical protein R3245_02505 [Kiloniellales bacterium]|nr:hypothetical protein [Kiloniellales bacterium]
MAELIEISADEILAKARPVAADLRAGALILIRRIEALREGRSALVTEAAKAGDSHRVVSELACFYEKGGTPSLETLSALSGAIKAFRKKAEWSRRLHPLFQAMNLPAPMLYDGGIPRLVLPHAAVSAARASGLFDATDFERLSAAGLTEIFMPRPANIHRDFNRTHFGFQVNLWFPLHDAGEEEVIRIFPKLYRECLYDCDVSSDALARVGPPARFSLAFGDAVLFHGEHLHTSPPVPADSGAGRRQSIDFRVVCDCPDDNRHYREGYVNALNFSSREGSAGIDIMLEMQACEALSKHRAGELLRSSRRISFAEDRFLLLAEKAEARDRNVTFNALKEVVGRSKLYFWILRAGESAKSNAFPLLAREAALRVLDLTQSTPVLPNYMAIDYPNPAAQLLPEEAGRRAAAILQELSGVSG